MGGGGGGVSRRVGGARAVCTLTLATPAPCLRLIRVDLPGLAETVGNSGGWISGLPAPYHQVEDSGGVAD